VVTQLLYMSDWVGRPGKRGNRAELKESRTFFQMSFHIDPIHMKMASLSYESAHDAAHARHVYTSRIWSAHNEVSSEAETTNLNRLLQYLQGRVLGFGWRTSVDSGPTRVEGGPGRGLGGPSID